MNSRNPQRLILDSTIKSVDLESIVEKNQDGSMSSGIPRSQLLVATFTTVAMIACDVPLPKEYYQLTRAYLDTIRNVDGTSLPNITPFVNYIDVYEEKNNIEDELQNTRLELPSAEMIEVPIEEAFGELYKTAVEGQEPLLSSTQADQILNPDVIEIIDLDDSQAAGTANQVVSQPENPGASQAVNSTANQPVGPSVNFAPAPSVNQPTVYRGGNSPEDSDTSQTTNRGKSPGRKGKRGGRN